MFREAKWNHNQNQDQTKPVKQIVIKLNSFKVAQTFPATQTKFWLQRLVVIGLRKIRLPQGRPSKVAMTMQYIIFGNRCETTGVDMEYAAPFSITFEVFEAKQYTMRVQEVVQYLNASACPGFLKNRLSTYRNKMLVPQYFFFHFDYFMGCFHTKYGNKWTSLCISSDMGCDFSD